MLASPSACYFLRLFFSSSSPPPFSPNHQIHIFVPFDSKCRHAPCLCERKCICKVRALGLLPRGRGILASSISQCSDQPSTNVGRRTLFPIRLLAFEHSTSGSCSDTRVGYTFDSTSPRLCELLFIFLCVLLLTVCDQACEWICIRKSYLACDHHCPCDTSNPSVFRFMASKRSLP